MEFGRTAIYRFLQYFTNVNTCLNSTQLYITSQISSRIYTIVQNRTTLYKNFTKLYKTLPNIQNCTKIQNKRDSTIFRITLHSFYRTLPNFEQLHIFQLCTQLNSHTTLYATSLNFTKHFT